MKRNLLSIHATIILVILSLSSLAQTGNRPSGPLIYGDDGYIYGAYTSTTAEGKRPSTIYRYLPGSAAIEPIYRFKDAVAEVYEATDQGWIYGTTTHYNISGNPTTVTVFSVKIDGKYYLELDKRNISPNDKQTAIVFDPTEFWLYSVRHNRNSDGGIVVGVSIDEYENNVIRSYENDSDLPTSILPFTHTESSEIYEGEWWDFVWPGLWLATDYGGTYGKGSINIYTIHDAQFEVPEPLNFTGYGGGGLDGEGPVNMVNVHDEGIYAVTQHGGANNEGAIFYMNVDSVYKVCDFTSLQGKPFGKPVVEFDHGRIFGLAGNFDNNTGQIYSYDPQTSLFNTVAAFNESSAVNKITSIVAPGNGVIYGTSGTTGSDTENGSLFSINADGSNTVIIFKFVDGYSELLEPNYTRTDVSVKPTLQADASVNASSYRIEISEHSDFTGTVHVVNSTDGSGKINAPVLKYATEYYTRVKTNIIDDYGMVRSFTTHGPEKYSFVSSPVHGATNVVVNGLKVTANIVYGATSYTIELNTSADFTGTSIVKTSTVANQRTIVFDGLQPSTTYYSRTRTNFPSNWGPTRSFTTAAVAPPPVFAAEMREIKVYPNPFEHSFTIEPEPSGIIDVSLVDLTGRELVKTQVIEQPAALGEQLAPGVYLLQIKQKDGRVTVKRMFKK